MTRNSGTMTSESRKKMPGRGKDKRTLILEAMRRGSTFGALETDTDEEVEVRFFEKISQTACDDGHKDSAMCTKLIADKLAPQHKPTIEKMIFEFDTNASPSEQSSQILNSVAQGILAPDVGKILIDSITNMIKIDEITILAEKLERLEKSLGGKDG